MTKNKSGFFKNLSSIFVDMDEKKEVEKVEVVGNTDTSVPTRRMSMNTTQGSSESKIPEQYRRTAISDTPVTPSIQAAFNEEFYAHFQKVIEDNDLDGSDYYEFRKTFDALKKTPNMSEIGALQATFSVLQATDPDISVDHLLTTADFYVGLMDKENKDFLGQLEENLQTEVESRKFKISSEEELQVNKLSLIEELKKEVSESEQRAITLQAEADAEESKLLGVKANWEFTINLVKENVETDKTNIEKYLIVKQ